MAIMYKLDPKNALVRGQNVTLYLSNNRRQDSLYVITDKIISYTININL